MTASTLTNPVSIPVSGTGADFQLAVQGASSNTVVGGNATTYQLLLTPVGASAGQVALTCSGFPVGSTCVANPSTVTMSGTGTTATILVAVTTAAPSASAQAAEGSSPWPGSRLPAIAIATFLPLLWRRGHTGWRFRQYSILLSATLLCAVISGCGLTIHGGSSMPTTPSSSGQGTYVLTVGATAPGLVRTVNLNLTVE
jgi:hypothetical protein